MTEDYGGFAGPNRVRQIAEIPPRAAEEGLQALPRLHTPLLLTQLQDGFCLCQDYRKCFIHLIALSLCHMLPCKQTKCMLLAGSSGGPRGPARLSVSGGAPGANGGEVPGVDIPQPTLESYDFIECLEPSYNL